MHMSLLQRIFSIVLFANATNKEVSTMSYVSFVHVWCIQVYQMFAAIYDLLGTLNNNKSYQ